MARKIAFVNFKGGVGKTSLVVNVAACLAHEARADSKVLVIDCDAQASASVWMMGMGEYLGKISSENSVYSLLTNKGEGVFNAIQKSVFTNAGYLKLGNLHLIPAVDELMDIEEPDMTKEKAKQLFEKFYVNVSALNGAYDYILFDCPPNLYRASRAAITVSDEIVVPCMPDELSNRGLGLLAKQLANFYVRNETFTSQIPDFVRAKITGLILNRVPTMSPKLQESITKIENKFYTLRDSSMAFHKKAEVYSIHVRQAVQAARLANDCLPAILDNQNQGLTQDYLYLSRTIAAHPLK